MVDLIRCSLSGSRNSTDLAEGPVLKQCLKVAEVYKPFTVATVTKTMLPHQMPEQAAVIVYLYIQIAYHNVTFRKTLLQCV